MNKVTDKLFWGDVTDPAVHDPFNFRYLVHMDTGFRFPGDKSVSYYIDDPSRIKTAARIGAGPTSFTTRAVVRKPAATSRQP